MRLEFGPKLRISYPAVFDHLGPTGPHFTLAQRPQKMRVHKNSAWILKGANAIFNAIKIDSGLAAKSRINLSQKRGGNRNKFHSAFVGACYKAA